MFCNFYGRHEWVFFNMNHQLHFFKNYHTSKLMFPTFIKNPYQCLSSESPSCDFCTIFTSELNTASASVFVGFVCRRKLESLWKLHSNLTRSFLQTSCLPSPCSPARSPGFYGNWNSSSLQTSIWQFNF